MVSSGLARPVLFRLGGGDPEAAHEWTLRRLAALSRRPARAGAAAAPVRGQRAGDGVRGRVPQPGGAGRRDGQGRRRRCRPGRRWGSGSSRSARSPRTPQPGNDRPRLFRLPASEAIDQPDGLQQRRARPRWPPGWPRSARCAVPLGISLGKSKVTPLEEAVEDYLASYRALREYGDYFAVNVSSPNTPGLRTLQDRDAPGRAAGRAGRGEAGAGEDRART